MKKREYHVVLVTFLLLPFHALSDTTGTLGRLRIDVIADAWSAAVPVSDDTPLITQQAPGGDDLGAGINEPGTKSENQTEIPLVDEPAVAEDTAEHQDTDNTNDACIVGNSDEAMPSIECAEVGTFTSAVPDVSRCRPAPGRPTLAIDSPLPAGYLDDTWQQIGGAWLRYTLFDELLHRAQTEASLTDGTIVNTTHFLTSHRLALAGVGRLELLPDGERAWVDLQKMVYFSNNLRVAYEERRWVQGPECAQLEIYRIRAERAPLTGEVTRLIVQRTPSAGAPSYELIPASSSWQRMLQDFEAWNPGRPAANR